MNWETEDYSATSGVARYWVNIASLSSSVDTLIYMCYGDSSITTDQSNKTAVWDSNFVGIYHLPDGSSFSSNDSTSNGYNATSSAVSATAGQIDGGGSYNGSSSYSDISGMTVTTNTNYTVSFWMKLTSNVSGALYEVWSSRSPTEYGTDLSVDYPTTGIHMDIGNGSGWISTSADASTSFSTGVWYYLVSEITATAYTHYVNASSVGNGTYGSSVPLLTDTNHFPTFGAYRAPDTSHALFFPGSLDEFRISKIARPVDWITTEYNNQLNPFTFETVSAETQFTINSNKRGLSINAGKIRIQGKVNIL